VDHDARGPLDIPPSCSGLRTILVPPDIVPVQRRSPLPVRKRTPWRPRPDGEATTARAGGREWFSDRLFVEPKSDYARAGFGTSMTMHAVCAVALLGALVVRAEPLQMVGHGPRLVMPASLAMLPADKTLLEAPTRASIERPTPKSSPRPSAPMASPAPPAAPLPGASLAAPVEAPPSIEPETGIEHGENGIERGAPGGTPGGLPDVPASGDSAASGPLRLGPGIKPPQRIRDVKPIYPQNAVPTAAQGAVILEATIGADGVVRDARVLRSIPALDQAALDAVRQWAYRPAELNGAPVAVIITIIVNFAIQ
jgi:periplasmic protein TonB